MIDWEQDILVLCMFVCVECTYEERRGRREREKRELLLLL
jgi:hypothetical protein